MGPGDRHHHHQTKKGQSIHPVAVSVDVLLWVSSSLSLNQTQVLSSLFTSSCPFYKLQVMESRQCNEEICIVEAVIDRLRVSLNRLESKVSATSACASKDVTVTVIRWGGFI